MLCALGIFHVIEVRSRLDNQARSATPIEDWSDRDAFDMKLAYVETGNMEKGVGFRFVRQVEDGHKSFSSLWSAVNHFDMYWPAGAFLWAGGKALHGAKQRGMNGV